ncbi:MAG: hypothetical protein KAT62_03700 [Desulfuromonadales bacterium]|nr:hypothetical protein [Desulfuromonadales bacterium]
MWEQIDCWMIFVAIGIEFLIIGAVMAFMRGAKKPDQMGDVNSEDISRGQTRRKD